MQSLVAQSLTERLMPGCLNEDFRDINGRKHTDMSDLINTVLYTQKPNIATPSVQLPLFSIQDQRFAENVQAKQLLDKNQFFYFNQTDKLKKQPLRHSFFFTGCDSLRDINSEDASPFTDHINKLINSKGSFQRGFYTSMRGEAHALPIPFPRFFTPRALTENGLLKPEVEESQKAK